MNRVGVIDIGPSSVRLMLTEVEEGGYFKIIDELKTSIRLCDDLVNGCAICSKNVNSILSTLRSYKSLCTVSGATKIFAVATESFRTASNKDLLISTIKEELDIDVNVLSCEDEIYLNYLGVTRSIYVENSLMVEVAGTATHIAWIQNNNIIKSATLPFGSVNLSSKYNLKDRVLPNDIDNALKFISDSLNEISWLKDANFDSIIGVAEIVRNLGKIDRVKKRYPFEIPHNYELTDIDVHDIFNIVKSKDFKQRQKIEGLDFEISDIVVGGISIFYSIVKGANSSKVVISGRGLREGVMYDYLKENFSITPDILDYSINGILDTLNINKCHAKHVFAITTKLFEELKPLHHLSDKFHHVVKTAAMLHDCGISINYYDHHKHSFYVILHSYINGLTHKELLMSAAIAASHRFNRYKLPLPPFASIINQLDLKSISQIGVLLKIAEGLDRSLVGAIKDINVEFDLDTVKLTVFSDIDVDLEIRQALRASDKFKEVYNKDLIIIKA
ncbi:Ppx/GppA phosphatase family protein [Clostridium chauvoei]|uniref:Ppx/GppA family phosphatase n=2 Tax=Clostridium chauvoei TaxID=46867 RepID=A0ABD4RG99_9CLOT|nr:Ppx/GppA phosphatase family protein [Clostridium chauvoei]ATD54743.1 exopolyphosphatase [Clostridium chauvoei]ATD57576.1 exopolyphosphatase [Clostridium chauvoei]MBX7280043.1 Ppx/GppA family phosphatase [Clostridium chauvoei]MBX7282298.1 Ppx/GppA family phosphatase [Clostridium chauvoei]MBX7284934.1 Ppx/GppA family phosphatase [Clostridium chauvoei]